MKTSKIFIGIDPGASGGMAAIEHECEYSEMATSPKGGVCMNFFMIDSWAWKGEQEANRTIHNLVTRYNGNVTIEAYLENVHAFPTDARSSAFKFGMNFGIWKGLLTGYGISYELKTPQTWMGKYGKLPPTKADRKLRLKKWAMRIAETLGSQRRVTLRTADAILITNCLSNEHLQEEDQIWPK